MVLNPCVRLSGSPRSTPLREIPKTMDMSRGFIVFLFTFVFAYFSHVYVIRVFTYICIVFSPALLSQFCSHLHTYTFFTFTHQRYVNCMNQNIRTIGGAIGTQVIAAIIASSVVPKESLYEAAFLTVGGVCLLGVVAAFAVPTTHRRDGPGMRSRRDLAPQAGATRP